MSFTIVYVISVMVYIEKPPSSPGPPTKPKPTKQRQRAMPLLPPIRKTPLPLPPTIQSNGSDTDRNSGYILMNPPNAVIKGSK